ncbi:MAG: hypothetical protein FJ213_02130 [Ignavibacteria bacterium]|nr:hypothetical protein [Ignavibacteria bacterium]
MKNNIKVFVPLFLITTITASIFMGCPGAKRDELEFLRSEVDSLRTEVLEFILQSNRLEFDNYVYGSKLNLNNLYKKSPHLFTIENINTINELLKLEQRPERVDKLERLKVHIYTEIVKKSTAALSDKIENQMSSGLVYTDRGAIPFYNLRSQIANEKIQSKRERLYKSANSIYKELNINYRKLYQIRKSIILDSLGFKSFNQFGAMVRSEDLNKFSKSVEGFISSTNELYFILLDDILRTNKLNRDNFFRYDVSRLLRNDKFDKAFPKDSLVSVWKNSFSSMGFEIDTMRNIILDMENRPTKNPRAACFTIEIPTDIRMSIKPIGGFDDYAALFHETGHALHYALTTEKFMEFQYLGNYTNSETYSFLFEHLLDEPHWLKNFLGMKEPEFKSFIKFRTFQRLYMARRYCAKFIYEYQLIDSFENAPDKYSEILSTVLGYKQHPSDKNYYLDDVDDFFYTVDYLRAWFIEAMFKTKIRELYGHNWFENKSLADYMKDYFSAGQRFYIDKFIQKIGFIDLDPKFLANELNEMRSFARAK